MANRSRPYTTRHDTPSKIPQSSFGFRYLCPMAGRGKPGRPSKGDRKPQTIRFPRDLHATAEQAAIDAGYDNFQDYIVDVVAMAHGQPVRFHPNRQQRLQISA